MAAYGSYNFPPLPMYNVGAGIRTEIATLVPPGARVAAYVRSTGVQDFDDSQIKRRLVPTLNEGLAQCRSGMGDVVFVLPGHAENVSSADYMSSLRAGTRIIGLGYGNLRPTFTWSLAGGTFLFDVANVHLSGCVLNMAGSRTSTTALTVAAPITISAAGCSIVDNEICVGVDMNQITTIPVTTTAAADDLLLMGNNFISLDTAAEVTTVLRIVGADRLKMIGNRFMASSSDVDVGLVQFITTDSTGVMLEDNWIKNTKAASTAAVIVSAGATSSTGFVNNLYLTTLANSANQLVLGHASGAWADSVGLFSFGRHVYVANLEGERMAEVTVVSA